MVAAHGHSRGYTLAGASYAAMQSAVGNRDHSRRTGCGAEPAHSPANQDLRRWRGVDKRSCSTWRRARWKMMPNARKKLRCRCKQVIRLLAPKSTSWLCLRGRTGLRKNSIVRKTCTAAGASDLYPRASKDRPAPDRDSKPVREHIGRGAENDTGRSAQAFSPPRSGPRFSVSERFSIGLLSAGQALPPGRKSAHGGSDGADQRRPRRYRQIWAATRLSRIAQVRRPPARCPFDHLRFAR